MYQSITEATLYYEEYGTGNRIIISAGQMLDPDRKGWPYDLAEKGFRVYVIQLRGYGKSSHIYSDFEKNWYDVWAQDICEFAHAKGIEKFLYTGQSDGAGVGWHLCVNHPEMLMGFVGISAGPHSRNFGKNATSRKNFADRSDDPDVIEQWAQYQRQRVLGYAKKFAHDEKLRCEFEKKAEKMYRIQKEKKPEELKINPGITLAQFASDAELCEEFRQIQVPVLLLNGMKDALLPMNRVAPAAREIPAAKIVYYQDASNSVQYDYRDDVREEIVRFADKIYAKFKN